MNKLDIRIIAVIVFALIALSAQAETVYTYTGNNFSSITDDNLAEYPGTYDTSMHVFGTFTLSSPIPVNSEMTDYSSLVTSFSLFDGRNNLTQSSGDVIFDFTVSTDGLGIPTNWHIQARSPNMPGDIQIGDPQFIVESYFDQYSNFDQGAVYICTALSDGSCNYYDTADAAQTETVGTWQVSGVPASPSASKAMPWIPLLLEE